MNNSCMLRKKVPDYSYLMAMLILWHFSLYVIALYMALLFKWHCSLNGITYLMEIHTHLMAFLFKWQFSSFGIAL